MALKRDGGAGLSEGPLATTLDTSLVRFGGFMTELAFSIIDTLLVSPGGFKLVVSFGC